MGNIKEHRKTKCTHIGGASAAEGGEHHFKMCLPSQVPLKHFKIKNTIVYTLLQKANMIRVYILIHYHNNKIIMCDIICRDCKCDESSTKKDQTTQFSICAA